MTTEFDFENKTVLLNSGYEMPVLGLGTWTQDDETAEKSVYEALKDGYRLIDTAQYYGNETIMDIAKDHGKTPAQVILRWHLQAGYVTIPGSQNPDHILENYSIFDFELTDEEMQRMAELHTGQRYENW